MIRVALLAVVILIAAAQPAVAHDCSSPGDCEQTAGYNAVIALAGGALALASGLIGNAIGGSEAPADTGAGPGMPPRRRGCCMGRFTMLLALPLAIVAIGIRAILSLG